MNLIATPRNKGVRLGQRLKYALQHAIVIFTQISSVNTYPKYFRRLPINQRSLNIASPLIVAFQSQLSLFSL